MTVQHNITKYGWLFKTDEVIIDKLIIKLHEMKEWSPEYKPGHIRITGVTGEISIVIGLHQNKEFKYIMIVYDRFILFEVWFILYTFKEDIINIVRAFQQSLEVPWD